MSSGKITNDEGLKAEALLDPKIFYWANESFLNSEIINFCYLISPNITNPTKVDLVEVNSVLL